MKSRAPTTTLTETELKRRCVQAIEAAFGEEIGVVGGEIAILATRRACA